MTAEGSMTAEADAVRLRAWTDFVLSYNQLMSVLEGEMQAGAGITLSQYDVLLRLAESAEGRLTMSELAGAVLYSTGGLTRLFERMRRAGLVRREPSDEDRRVIYAVLTEAGMARLRAASAVHVEGVRRHFGALLADGEAGTVAGFLGRLHASLRLFCGADQAPRLVVDSGDDYGGAVLAFQLQVASYLVDVARQAPAPDIDGSHLQLAQPLSEALLVPRGRVPDPQRAGERRLRVPVQRQERDPGVDLGGVLPQVAR